MASLRDGVPRRLTFKRVDKGFKLLKVLNVSNMNEFVGCTYEDEDLKVFSKDPKVDVVVK